MTTLRVKSLNGFTRARNPSLANASRVRFDLVSSNNPLAIEIYDTSPGFVARNVIGFTPDLAGDEEGPGTLLLSAAVTVLDRAAIRSSDRTGIVRAGGGDKIDDLTSVDKPTFVEFRAAIAMLRGNNVPTHSDGLYHAHLDPTSESLSYNNDEFQRLNTSLPDYHFYKDFSLGKILGCLFIRNNEAPLYTNTRYANGAAQAYSLADPFAGELQTPAGMNVHRILFTGQDYIREYYADQSGLVSEAGLTGKMKDPGRITSDGIELFVERVKLIYRAPLDRLQSKVAATWSFIGTWTVPTDASAGGPARIKRAVEVQHGE